MTAIAERPRIWRVFAAPAVWLERARGRRRLLLVGAYLAVALVMGALAYRQTRLIGLPDVGDPFDTAPVLALSIPDDQNSFVLAREATARLRHDNPIEIRIFNTPWAWPAGDPEALAFLEANAEALELWRASTDRPDSLERPVAELDFRSNLSVVQEHRHFVRLARLHIDKAQSAGDMEEAWRWLRAILRGSRLLGRHGTIIARLVGNAEYAIAAGPVKAWAADPRTSPEQVRRALDELRAIDAMTPSFRESIQIEYLTVMHTLDDPEKLWTFLLDDPWNVKLVDGMSWQNHLMWLQRGRRFLQAEPERSRRLARLAYTNWLAHCDDLPDRRPALVGAVLPRPTKATPPPPGNQVITELFDVPPAAGPSPSALANAIHDTWLASSLILPFQAFLKSNDRDRVQRAALELALAEELFRRERGRDPESADELVGTVIDRLPEGYTPPADPEASP